MVRTGWLPPDHPHAGEGDGARDHGDGRPQLRLGAPPPRSGVSDSTVAGGLMAVVGGWLLVSPWIVGYRGEDPAWSAVACGAALIALALARTAAATLAVGMSLLGAAIGMWTFAGAFWLYDTTGGAWNAVVTGTVVIVLGMWSATAVDAPLGAGITDRATAAQRRHRWQ